MVQNYQKICEDLLKDLPDRQREVISRRFGLTRGQEAADFETLESIGKDFGVTRERVRQIEEDGLDRIKEKMGKYEKVFQSYSQHLNKFGGLRKESVLLEELGGKEYQPQACFLLNIGKGFERSGETEEFYPMWFVDKKSVSAAKKVITFLSSKLKKIKKPLASKDLKTSSSVDNESLLSYLEASKKIQKNDEGFFGLREWPEINPRGIKDRAYLAFKKVQKPLHFKDVAGMINGSLVQTVHNELIRDPRFVLVGRGIYALSEWGYIPGEVKEVIFSTLKEKGPLTKEEILKIVLGQRMVKENTVLLNLSNRDYFLRDTQGRYKVKEA